MENQIGILNKQICMFEKKREKEQARRREEGTEQKGMWKIAKCVTEKLMKRKWRFLRGKGSANK